MTYLLSTGIFIHIIGITLIAGGSIGGLVLETHIWKVIHQSPEKVSVLGPLMPKFPVVIQIGTLLMFISGFMMLAALGWTVAGQWWFIIKMALVVALILNGILIAKPTGKRLLILVPQLIHGEAVQMELKMVRRKMILFHISELAMLALVYLLGVFQF